MNKRYLLLISILILNILAPLSQFALAQGKRGNEEVSEYDEGSKKKTGRLDLEPSQSASLSIQEQTESGSSAVDPGAQVRAADVLAGDAPALVRAILERDSALVRQLLADPDATYLRCLDDKGNTVIHYLAKFQNDPNIIAYLFKRVFKYEALLALFISQNNDGDNPIDIALAAGNDRVVSVLEFILKQIEKTYGDYLRLGGFNRPIIGLLTRPRQLPPPPIRQIRDREVRLLRRQEETAFWARHDGIIQPLVGQITTDIGQDDGQRLVNDLEVHLGLADHRAVHDNNRANLLSDAARNIIDRFIGNFDSIGWQTMTAVLIILRAHYNLSVRDYRAEGNAPSQSLIEKISKLCFFS